MCIEQLGILIDAFVAIGTIGLAVIAYLTIQHTRKAQQTARKREQIVEIIECANDVIKLVTEKIFEDLTTGEDILHAVMTIRNRFESLSGRLEHIKSIALNFEPDLQTTVSKMSEMHEVHLETLIECQRKIMNSYVGFLKKKGKKDVEIKAVLETMLEMGGELSESAMGLRDAAIEVIQKAGSLLKKFS